MSLSSNALFAPCITSFFQPGVQEAIDQLSVQEPDPDQAQCPGIARRQNVGNVPFITGTTIYGDGIPRGILHRQIGGSSYQMVSQDHEDDQVGVRRLIRRQFYKHQGVDLVIEYVLTRVSTDISSSGWSHDTVVFREGTRSPFQWDHNNRPVLFAGLDDTRQEAQDALSQR